jgi:hypothetical protein
MRAHGRPDQTPKRRDETIERAKTVEQGVVQYFLKEQDWFRPAADFEKWDTFTNWNLSLIYLRLFLNELVEQKQLISVKALDLPSSIWVRRLDGSSYQPDRVTQHAVVYLLPAAALLNRYTPREEESPVLAWAKAESARIEDALHLDEVRVTLSEISVSEDPQRRVFIQTISDTLFNTYNRSYNLLLADYKEAANYVLVSRYNNHLPSHSELRAFAKQCMATINEKLHAETSEAFRNLKKR